ncbi:MAG: hypothetical protein ABI042_12680 [Verrucomicrobiota bacterium]
MTLTEFIPNFIEYSKSEGFGFYLPTDQFSGFPKASGKSQMLLAAATAAAFTTVFGSGVMAGAIGGALVGTNIGHSNRISKDELVADLQKMKEYCDLICIKSNTGGTNVRIMIDADGVSGETLVGRCAMIHERGLDFRKYTMTLFKSWIFGGSRLPTIIEVVMIFSTHKLARDFLQNYADKCKHSKKGVMAYPWIVDLEDHEITRKTLNVPFLTKKYAEMLKAGFFRRV